MKTPLQLLPHREPLGHRLACLIVLCAGLSAQAATLSDWEFRQDLQVSAPGLMKISLPPATLDAARPRCEDVRVIGPDGSEVPWLIDRPRPASESYRRPTSFRVFVEGNRTRVTIEREGTQRVVGFLVETPASQFVKPVTVEAAGTGGGFEPIVSNVPIFRQSGGASQLFIAVPDTQAQRFNLLLDDRRAAPIPVSGVQLFEKEGDPPANESVAVAILDRSESPGQTRLTLDLGAANLSLASLAIESPDALFSRRVTVLARRVEENEVREQVLTAGTIFRVALEGQTLVSRLDIPLDMQLTGRELVVQVDNGDSPPINISGLRLERRPTLLVFMARAAGLHQVFTGNFKAPAPRYDLAALSANLKAVPPAPIALSGLMRNSDYRPAETLPTIPMLGSPLEVKDWKFRKRVSVEKAGVQQLEFDLQVLSRALPGFGDLRLLSDGKQIPYILERTSLIRTLQPEVKSADDPKKPQTSRWSLALPEKSVPLTRVICESPTPLFQREIRCYEVLRDERGEKFDRDLGSASWRQMPDRNTRQFTLQLNASPRSGELFLETHNGDNPAIVLENFKVTYPATRLLFKAGDRTAVDLYYGNARASAPSYDLSLVAGQILAAPKAVALPGEQEQLKAGPWLGGEGEGGMGTALFWGVLGVVVISLLVILTRMLPKTSGGGPESGAE